jgi:hypothetical protein
VELDLAEACRFGGCGIDDKRPTMHVEAFSEVLWDVGSIPTASSFVRLRISAGMGENLRVQLVAHSGASFVGKLLD